MRIETKISLEEYIKLMYTLTYRKKSMLYISILGLFFFSFSILYLIGIIETTEFTYFPIGFSALIVLILPFTVYFSAKKNYQTDNRLQEVITYDINEELITIKGETFNSEMTWDKMHKVIELKSWLLLYHNKMVANIIPKDSIENMRELRVIIRKQNIKSKLKKN